MTTLQLGQPGLEVPGTMEELGAGGNIAVTPTASAAAAREVIRAEVRTLTVTGPDIQALLQAVSTDMEIVPLTDVDSDDMAAELQASLGRLSTVSAAIEKERLERGKPLRDTLEWLKQGYDPARGAVDLVIEEGKAKLLAWQRHKQEVARQAAEAEAKRRREAAEAAARAEAAALAAANEAAAKAAAARAEGSEQVAAAMESDAMVQVDTARATAAHAAARVYAGPVTAPVTAIKGARETWKAEVTDKAALIQHIGERIAAGDPSLVDLLDVNTTALNATAKLQKQHMRIPGVRSYTVESVSVRKQAVAA